MEARSSTVGGRIKAARKAKGLTQSQLAEMLGWGERGQVRLSHYEVNRRRPGIEEISQIASALNCSLKDLCEEADLPKAKSTAPPADLDERRRLMRVYNQLGPGRRDAVYAYAESLLGGESQERAKLVADVRQIAKMSTPRTAELVESLASVISSGLLRDSDAATIRQLLVSLTRR